MVKKQNGRRGPGKTAKARHNKIRIDWNAPIPPEFNPIPEPPITKYTGRWILVENADKRSKPLVTKVNKISHISRLKARASHHF